MDIREEKKAWIYRGSRQLELAGSGMRSTLSWAWSL
jgi:hypothetical protein